MVFPPVSCMCSSSRMHTTCPAHHAASYLPSSDTWRRRHVLNLLIMQLSPSNIRSCVDYRENTNGKFYHCEKSLKVTWYTYHIGVTCLVVFNAVRYIHYYVRELQHCSEPLNWKGITVSALIMSANIDCPNSVFLEKLLVSHLAKKFVALW
jgi:hypothetical protein